MCSPRPLRFGQFKLLRIVTKYIEQDVYCYSANYVLVVKFLLFFAISKTSSTLAIHISVCSK